MKAFHGFLTSCAVAVVVPGSLARADVVSTFDTDMDGWSYSGDLQSWTHEDSGGNPGGYVSINDAASGDLFYLYAPAKFLGDLSDSNGESLSFDYVLFDREINDPLDDFAQVRITGTGGSVALDLGSVPGVGDWTTYTANLDATTWGMSEGDWATLLGDVTEIRVGLEAINGDEQSGFDNFRIVPEPASVTLMLLGAGGLLFRRRG